MAAFFLVVQVDYEADMCYKDTVETHHGTLLWCMTPLLGLQDLCR
jgi:hypothetical protein